MTSPLSLRTSCTVVWLGFGWGYGYGGHFVMPTQCARNLIIRVYWTTLASWRCRQNLKFENFTSSFGRLRQKIAPKSMPHVQHDYFFPHSTNQIIDLWRCRFRCRCRHFLNSVLLKRRHQRQRLRHNMIGRMKKYNRAARAAYFRLQFFDVVCQTTT